MLWGAYLGSNLFWFDILMPISGLLKSSNGGDHAFGHNLPHTALISLIICAISIAILWRKQRDRWFLFAELPFFLGILMHAAYITLKMTGETRWTWYYVSWALLAALTASRATACLFRAAPATEGSSTRRPSLAAKLHSVGILLAIVFSALLFYKMGWKHSREQVAEETTIPALRQVLDDDHMYRLLAYDQPGGMAYFTDASVVPLDGLMADREFQTELAQKGIGEFIRRDNIDGFAGPHGAVRSMGKGHVLRPSIFGEHEIYLRAMDGFPGREATVDDHRRRSVFADTVGARGIYFSATVAHCVDGQELCDDLESFPGG